MKKIILAACAILTAITSFAATSYKTSILVNLKSGETLEFKFAETPEALCEGLYMVFKVNDTRVNYPMVDIVNITFNTTVGVQGIMTDRPAVSFAIDATTLSADMLAPGEELAVYTIDGIKIASTHADGEGSARLDISKLNGGTYIAATASKSFKFLKVGSAN